MIFRRDPVFRFCGRANWLIVNLFKPKVARSVYGPRFEGRYGDQTFRHYIRGNYGRDLSRLISSANRPFSFIDIGANQGLYSLLAARNGFCDRVVAFEPVKSTFALLEKNIALNDVNKKVETVNAAISDVAGAKQISYRPEHSGGSSLERSGGGSETETIVCVSHEELDRYLDAPSGRPIFVKIDVEGHEPIVLSELRHSANWTAIRWIFFEVDERWCDGNRLIADLERDGFRHEATFPGKGKVAASHYDVFMAR